MISKQSQSVAARAKSIYAEKLQADLESQHLHAYVAIEPDSGEYFLGDTFSAAIASAILAYPDRITFVMRIGHAAALHTGLMICLPSEEISRWEKCSNTQLPLDRIHGVAPMRR